MGIYNTGNLLAKFFCIANTYAFKCSQLIGCSGHPFGNRKQC
jgi:hypothetical protein